MNKISGNKVGLALGGLLAIFHAFWALMVLANLAKPLMDWILSLHFITLQYYINPFSFGNALLLVIVTGIIGYILGWIFAWLWNIAHGASHNE